MSLRAAAEQAALALEAWDQLADYQLDGTAEAKAALREADAAGARALAALRRALAEEALNEMQAITESDYSEGGQE